MSSDEVVQARVRQETKREAEAILSAIGLTVSDALRLLLVRVVAERKLPFEPLVPNEATIQAMLEARSGGGKRFRTVDELMADLNARD